DLVGRHSRHQSAASVVSRDTLFHLNVCSKIVFCCASRGKIQCAVEMSIKRLDNSICIVTHFCPEESDADERVNLSFAHLDCQTAQSFASTLTVPGACVRLRRKGWPVWWWAGSPSIQHRVSWPMSSAVRRDSTPIGRGHGGDA